MLGWQLGLVIVVTLVFVGAISWVAADARIYRDPAGREMEVSTGADYTAFSDWAMTTLFAH